MEYNSVSLSEIPQRITEPRRLFHKVTASTFESSIRLNIFHSTKNQYDPNDKPLGGNNIIRRIRQNSLKSSPSDYMNKVTLSTKMDTLPQESRLKTKTQYNSSTPAPKRIQSTSHVLTKQEDILKKDVIGLSVDHIKVIRKRPFSNSKKQTIYDRTAKPFLQNMGQRSMSQYNQELRNKFGNKYFQKTLRNAYKDDAPKTFMVTLFDTSQKQIKSKLRKNIVNLPFFKRHQFIEIKGQNKKQKQTKAIRAEFG